MCLREHVLNFFTGPNIPFRYIMFSHSCFPLITKSLSFTDGLHDSERKTALYAHTDEVDHDVISCTDCGGNRCFSLFDQGLCIAKPYVRTMRQTGNTYKVRKILWLCINQHLHRKIRTKLRHTKAAKLTAADIFRFYSQCLRTCKQRHNFFAVQRNISGT